MTQPRQRCRGYQKHRLSPFCLRVKSNLDVSAVSEKCPPDVRISRQKISALTGPGKIRISLWSTNVVGGESIETTKVMTVQVEETKWRTPTLVRFWDYLSWMNKTQATAPTLSLLCPAMIYWTDVYVQVSTTAPSVPHLPTTLHPLAQYLQIPPQCRRPCLSRVLPLWTTSSSSNGTKAALRRRFLFDNSNRVHCFFGINPFLAA